MKAKHKKTILITSIVLGTIVVVPSIFCLVCNIIGDYEVAVSQNLLNTPSSTNGKYASMYTNKYSQIENEPLTKINWFGSHDSGTYGLFNRGLGEDGKEEGFANFAQIMQLGVFASKLGQMQSETIYNQLEDGVRYLDLRLSNSGSSYDSINDIYITHSFLFASFVEVVNQINTFIKQNPNEIIFIDINHWYPSDKNNERMQKIVLDYLLKIFGNKIADSSQYSLSDPYSKFINPNDSTNNKNIILLFANSYISDNHIFNSINTNNLDFCKTVAMKGNTLISYWTGDNEYDTNKIINKLNQFLDIKKQYPNNLYVVQAIPNWDALTTFSGFILGATGYSMDLWFNIGNSLAYCFTSAWYSNNSKYMGIILMVNNVVSKVNNVIPAIDWSLSYIQ